MNALFMDVVDPITHQVVQKNYHTALTLTPASKNKHSTLIQCTPFNTPSGAEKLSYRAYVNVGIQKYAFNAYSMYAPVLFSPLLPSLSAAEFKTGEIRMSQIIYLIYLCGWANLTRTETKYMQAYNGEKKYTR